MYRGENRPIGNCYPEGDSYINRGENRPIGICYLEGDSYIYTGVKIGLLVSVI